MNQNEIDKIKIKLKIDEINELLRIKEPDEELIYLFNAFKRRHWIPYDRKQSSQSDGLLGNIFEDIIGLNENNLSKPDYKNIELKTKNLKSLSPISLFCLSCNSIQNAATILREEFGEIEDGGSFDEKILNTRVKYKKWNTHRNGYSFTLDINKKQNKLFLRVKNISTGFNLDDDRFWWDLDKIQRSLLSKIKNCALIHGEVNKNERLVKFNSMYIYKDVIFENFIRLLKEGYIYLELRIGIYKSGLKIGKTHDHGTSFRISHNKISDLYESIISNTDANH